MPIVTDSILSLNSNFDAWFNCLRFDLIHFRFGLLGLCAFGFTLGTTLLPGAKLLDLAIDRCVIHRRSVGFILFQRQCDSDDR